MWPADSGTDQKVDRRLSLRTQKKTLQTHIHSRGVNQHFRLRKSFIPRIAKYAAQGGRLRVEPGR